MGTTAFNARHGFQSNGYWNITAANGNITHGTLTVNTTSWAYGSGPFANSTHVGVGSFLYSNATAHFAGNSTVNSVLTSTQLQVANATQNTFVTVTGFVVGNATVASALYQTYLQVGTTAYANSTYAYFGTAGQFGPTNGIYVTSGANVGIGTSGPSLKFHVAGDIGASGDVYTAYSDERLKIIDGDVDPAEATKAVKSLRTFFYRPSEEVFKLDPSASPKSKYGVSAQEIERAFPGMASLSVLDRGPDGRSASGKDYLTIDYSRLTVPILAAMKDLINRVETLEKK